MHMHFHLRKNKNWIKQQHNVKGQSLLTAYFTRTDIKTIFNFFPPFAKDGRVEIFASVGKRSLNITCLKRIWNVSFLNS